jgi:hypothetical protein
MTSADRNDLMPAQEKLEWVTPKVSLMDAGDTEGKQPFLREITVFFTPHPLHGRNGPS